MKKMKFIITSTLFFSLVAYSHFAFGANPSTLNISEATYDSNQNSLTLKGSNIDQFETISVTVGSEIFDTCNSEILTGCCEVTQQLSIICYLDDTPISGNGTYSVTVRQGQGNSGADSIDAFIPSLPPPACFSGDFRSCYSGNPVEIGVGPCIDGLRSCVNGSWETSCVGEVTAVPESCNDMDDDCDGEVDEGYDVDNDGVTTCEGDCNDANPNINPNTAEICDGVDNDCDGQNNENWPYLGSICYKGIGVCRTTGVYVCSGGGTAAICNAAEPRQPTTEICNNFDDDCNGLVDEGINPVPTINCCSWHTEYFDCNCNWLGVCDTCSRQVCDRYYTLECANGTMSSICH